MKKNVPKMPIVTAYITSREIKRVLEMNKAFGDGSDDYEAKVHVKIGYGHLTDALKRIVSYLERRNKYDEELLLKK
jgi:hypothetical protein